MTLYIIVGSKSVNVFNRKEMFKRNITSKVERSKKCEYIFG